MQTHGSPAVWSTAPDEVSHVDDGLSQDLDGTAMSDNADKEGQVRVDERDESSSQLGC
jgi:hypothetical protein|tara:strand:- start:18595 stop:18768 length:174 start_codon:yes stop_codon:yes gene_type:complete